VLQLIKLAYESTLASSVNSQSSTNQVSMPAVLVTGPTVT